MLQMNLELYLIQKHTQQIHLSHLVVTARASRPLIRSGMQPNIAGQQNSGRFNSANNPNRYSYSYRELLNNRRKATYMKKLPVVESEM